MAIYNPSMDTEANSKTRSYLSQLQAKVNSLQITANKMNALASSAEAAAKFEKAYLDLAKVENTTAQGYYSDAETALEKIQTLAEFFQDREKQAEDAHTDAQETALKVFTAAAEMNKCAQAIEASFNMANQWNSDLQSNPDPTEVPYTGPIFMHNFTVIYNDSKSAFKAMTTASLSAFNSLSDAKQALVMAQYLNKGIQTTYSKMQILYSQAEKLMQASFLKYTLAEAAYNQAETQMEIAEENAAQANFQLDMVEAELRAAVAGAAGISTKLPPKS